MDQAENLVENYWSTLQQVFSIMDPLSHLPSTIFELIDFFTRSKGQIRIFVWKQLDAGTEAALALVRVHYPNIDLTRVSGGPPVGLGRRTVSMVSHL